MAGLGWYLFKPKTIQKNASDFPIEESTKDTVKIQDSPEVWDKDVASEQDTLLKQTRRSDQKTQLSVKKIDQVPTENMGLLVSGEYEVSFEQKTNESNRILVNGVGAGLLEKGEMPVHLTGNSLYTTQKKGDCVYGDGTFTVREKTINGSELVDKTISEFPCSGRTIHFFENGDFVFRQSGEGISLGFQFYDSQQQLVNSYLPESEDRISYVDIYEDKLLIGESPTTGDTLNTFVLTDNLGKILFKKKLALVGDVGKILASRSYVALYVYSDFPKITHTLMILDLSGNLVSEALINGPVQNWTFTNSIEPSLLIGYPDHLETRNPKTAEVINDWSFIELYTENDIRSSRSDNYIELVDFVALDGRQTGILFSQPVNGNAFVNNLIFIFSEEGAGKKKFISLENSSYKPQIKSRHSDISVMLDGKISNYD